MPLGLAGSLKLKLWVFKTSYEEIEAVWAMA